MLKGLFVANSSFVGGLFANYDADLDNSLYLAIIQITSSTGGSIYYRRMLGGDKRSYKYTLGTFKNSYSVFYIATYGFNGTVGS